MFFQSILRFGFGVAYVVMALLVMTVFMLGSRYGVDNSPDVRLPPVTYRVLVPAIHDTVRSLLPEGLKERMTPALVAFRESHTGKRLLRVEKVKPYHLRPLEDHRIFDTFVTMALVYLWLLAAVWMLYRLAAALFPESELYALLAPLLCLWLLPPFFTWHGYTYDFAELFFSSACLYLLFKRRWWPYLACFALATLNKETSLFVIIFFAIWFFTRLPRRLYVQLLLLQVLTYGLLESIIITYSVSYQGLSPTNASFNAAFFDILVNHVAYLYGYNYYTVISGVATLGLLLYRWREKPSFLLGGLWMAAANIGAYVLTCNTGEYRDLLWSVPVLVLLATHTVVRLLELDQLPVFRCLQRQPEGIQQAAMQR